MLRMLLRKARTGQNFSNEPGMPKVKTKILQKTLQCHEGYCYHSKIFILRFSHHHYTISIEHINTWMPYLESNICLFTAVMNCTDTCGGIPFLKNAGEGDNNYLDHDIVNHVSCGWNWQMVEEHQNEYCQVKSIGKDKHNAMVC